MYLIGSNVSNFENRKQLLNHLTLSYTVLPVQGDSSQFLLLGVSQLLSVQSQGDSSYVVWLFGEYQLLSIQSLIIVLLLEVSQLLSIQSQGDLSQFCYWEYISYFLPRARETYHSFAIGSVSATLYTEPGRLTSIIVLLLGVSQLLSIQSQGDLSQFCYRECLSYFLSRARETYHSFVIALRVETSLFALRTKLLSVQDQGQPMESKCPVKEFKKFSQ